MQPQRCALCESARMLCSHRRTAPRLRRHNPIEHANCPVNQWGDGELVRLLLLYRSAIVDELGSFHVTGRKWHCGSEGCVVFAESDIHGPVVIKIGKSKLKGRSTIQSDFYAGAQVVGVYLPGVATTLGVWRNNGTACLVRDRVNTSWRDYATERGVDYDGVRVALDVVVLVGREHSDACDIGGVSDSFLHNNTMGYLRFSEVLGRYGFMPVVHGMRALLRLGVCVGNDIYDENLGWRYDDRDKPEPVILDLGHSESPRGARRWSKPHLVRR